MIKEDICKIVQYEEEYLGSTLGVDYLTNMLNSPFAYIICAIEDDKLVGYLSANVDEYSEVLNFFVVKEYRRNGYASKLFEALISKAKDINSKSIYLEVSEKNIAAQALYKKFGFNIDHIRKGYYKDSDAYAMIKEL